MSKRGGNIIGITIHKKLAKTISYDSSKKRKLNSITYIVIHYTGNNGDTAKGNSNYFSTSNTRQAGAHFFVDKSGEIYKSINMNRIAWAVGGKYTTSGGAGSCYGKCTNTNSVSIELCDCCTDTNWTQKVATRKLIKYIQKKCPNAKTIIRHWDVNGKSCPAPFIGRNNKKWNTLLDFFSDNYQFDGKITKNAAIRTSAKLISTNKIGTIKKGSFVKIDKLKGYWCRISGKDNEGRYYWIALSKVKEV